MVIAVWLELTVMIPYFSGSDGDSNAAVIVGASVGGGVVLLLLTASAIALLTTVAMRRHQQKHSKSAPESISEYASVLIVRIPEQQNSQPKLPERHMRIHTEENVAYCSPQLKGQLANEDAKAITNGPQPYLAPIGLSKSEPIEDGYPIMKQGAPGPGGLAPEYLEVLPPSTGDTGLTVAAEASHSVTEPGIEGDDTDGDEDDDYI